MSRKCVSASSSAAGVSATSSATWPWLSARRPSRRRFCRKERCTRASACSVSPLQSSQADSLRSTRRIVLPAGRASAAGASSWITAGSCSALQRSVRCLSSACSIAGQREGPPASSVSTMCGPWIIVHCGSSRASGQACGTSGSTATSSPWWRSASSRSPSGSVQIDSSQALIQSGCWKGLACAGVCVSTSRRHSGASCAKPLRPCRISSPLRVDEEAFRGVGMVCGNCMGEGHLGEACTDPASTFLRLILVSVIFLSDVI